ncbi:MAG: hypothetical protein Q7U08_04950 [Flavobacteriaceae bacterium]|jgi:hypothetical protein|nr:hypothetical protein [Flavobacteriaceae bacterium]
MKKILLLFTLTTLLISCEKPELTSQENINQKLNPKEFNIIGEQHNKGLEFVYNSLSANLINQGKLKITKTNSRATILQNILDEAEQYCAEYVDEYSIIHNDPTAYIAHLYNTQVFDGKPIISSTGNLYSDDISDKLVISQKNLLNELNIVMSDDDYNLSSLNSRIDNIEMRIPSFNLTVDEQLVLYSATSVARHTLEYWNVNLEKWQTSLGDLEVVRTIGYNWKSIGKHDVAGAVSVAYSMSWANMFGPISTSAWIIGIGGGAIGASTYEAIMQTF